MKHLSDSDLENLSLELDEKISEYDNMIDTYGLAEWAGMDLHDLADLVVSEEDRRDEGAS